ncbi:M48 family metallopeptidase [Hahella ganghwensis]|uniref:M48 family metallopeptidase n=1 Tax=Hahella ganghwensis TaxID=286420 RepID=UPI0003712A26|nr:SprT family zinc-dependent metalloprotease [Hahella ganghwensis]
MVQYEIIRSAKRKTVVIEVHRDQSVKVRAPLRFSEREIDKLVRQKSQWISDQQLRQASLPQRETPPGFEDGSVHYFLGEEFTLRWTPGLFRTSLLDRELCIPFPDRKSEAQAERSVKEWYRRQANKLFSERINFWMQHMEDWGVSRPELKLRFMKRYWGSCSSKGIVTLNVHLLKVPMHLLDYVVTHELSHLKEMNHSAKFYAWQAMLVPDWKQRREELKSWECRVLV